ncbi:ABC transporter ATP-binding protein [Aquidulcibacter sp.]|jgi:ABC-type polysaccharide/polyol phosphate transport system ATPase subunit|uniref:ABC transporter ATP-binding protein n=1 Tax=Aquidulcibacter sp. TaxID=2052990 RepID=UPI0022C9D6F4|nr:ABC transporter ATP-binding protein [Aquidulcibacter sp.]
MTSDTVIRAEGLGKKYIIGHQSADRPNTFRDAISQNVRNFLRGAGEMARGKAIVAGDELEEFWALKDVNFEIKRGEVVGIIGRNGAGKSTLLKVLSRITEPSDGRVEIKGRVASLLEVGTGFHPELSGRENIFLNGAILGMTRAEIARKFDEIVDFSGVEKFLDTPVKRYSSGMYVRLAFAVAAHLEPEILVVDEVLAVGDAEFQKKCLGKMQDVAGQGRTVLFVSHNMGAIKSLCKAGILMKHGTVAHTGEIQGVLDAYSQQLARSSTTTGNMDNLHVERLVVDFNGVPKIQIDLGGLTVPAGTYEVRAFLTAVSGTAVGIGSVGGFGSKGLEISQNQRNVGLVLEMPNLAHDIYLVTIEVLDVQTHKVVSRLNLDEIDFAPPPLAGENHALDASWGLGFNRLPLSLELRD